MKTTKEKIINMFFEEHLLPCDIARNAKVSKAYVTKVIQSDSRYNEEKLTRRKNNKVKRNERNKLSARAKRYAMKQSAMLKSIHDKDAKYLSTKYEMSDEDFARCNLSIYTRNKDCDLVAVKGVNLTYDVPKKYLCKENFYHKIIIVVFNVQSFMALFFVPF